MNNNRNNHNRESNGSGSHFLADSTPWTARTEMLIGAANLGKLRNSHVFVAGLGGVGGMAAEMIVRAGVGEITIADSDVVHPTNRNRQIVALKSTEGFLKAEVMAARLKDINPEIRVNTISEYLKGDILTEIASRSYDYVVDAIDTLAPKIFLIYNALQAGNKIVSSMGSGGKTDPENICISDIADSHTCRLAYILRKRLHRLGVYSGFKVVFSPEKVDPESYVVDEPSANKKTTIGTISYMPPLFGCFIASVVVRDLTE
ncbi:MAG: tRNA threonylcarbamoyladenosine dehydratase [Bacteroidetes bacterium]|nr:tRNA threonylcarbamoyladenosine dehydratase [Bacteroidota bacterium]MBU1717610.1 tRNA threonylcarbamoyladenosine dehydratase [Bacteroidota bacterium]